MGYEDLIRAGVALASSQFDSMKVSVTVTPWIGQDGDGDDSYGTPFLARALLDPSPRMRSTPTGRLIMTFATLTFLDPIANTTPNSGQVRQQPIDSRDIITLPDGSTAPIIQVGGFTDSGTEKPFATEVILGTLVRGE
jgi:hypothetical protein